MVGAGDLLEEAPDRTEPAGTQLLRLCLLTELFAHVRTQIGGRPWFRLASLSVLRAAWNEALRELAEARAEHVQFCVHGARVSSLLLLFSSLCLQRDLLVRRIFVFERRHEGDHVGLAALLRGPSASVLLVATDLVVALRVHEAVFVGLGCLRALLPTRCSLHWGYARVGKEDLLLERVALMHASLLFACERVLLSDGAFAECCSLRLRVLVLGHLSRLASWTILLFRLLWRLSWLRSPGEELRHAKRQAVKPADALLRLGRLCTLLGLVLLN